MRLSAIIPIALSLAALILSVLVLYAGRNSGFLNDTYIIKIDTSNLGANGTSVDVSNTGITAVDSIVDSTTRRIINSTASRLGLHDFYQAYIMNYCEGNRDSSNKEQTTNCTNQKGMFIFDPVSILEQELSRGVTLEDLGVDTQDLDKAVKALNAAYRTMFVTYCIGIAAAGICIIVGFLGFLESRLAACVNWMFAVISFLFLGVASGIGTTAAVKLRDAINQHMGSIGVRAYYSRKYLGMTWTAVIAMLIVTFFWCGACFSGRKDRSRRKDVDERALTGSGPAGKKRTWTRWRH